MDNRINEQLMLKTKNTLDFSDENVQIILEETISLLYEISFGYEQAIEQLVRENAELKAQCSRFGMLFRFQHAIKQSIKNLARFLFWLGKRILVTLGLFEWAKQSKLYKKLFKKGIIAKLRA